MFDWKYLQISAADYETLMENENQAQMKDNNKNLTEIEYFELYQEVQNKSTNSKTIKKGVLTFENNLKQILLNSNAKLTPKEIVRLNGQYISALRVRLQQLYDIIAMFRIRNISSTVEFCISRLLTIIEQLIKSHSDQLLAKLNLKMAIQTLEQEKLSRFCITCGEDMQKKRNKYLTKQIVAVEQSTAQLQEQNYRQQVKLTKREILAKQQRHRNDQEEETERFYYLNSVEQILKNRQKTLNCTSTPLQQLLSDYLTEILEMLEGVKLAESISPISIMEYDRVNRSHETLEDMKSQINFKRYFKNVQGLLKKPFQNLVENIQKIMMQSKKPNKRETSTEAQTNFIKQFDQIKLLQKDLENKKYQIQHIRHTRLKSETDMMNNMEALHKTELKNMELVNKVKAIEAEKAKLESQIVNLGRNMAKLETSYREDHSKIIDLNVKEKRQYIKSIKTMEEKLKKFESIKIPQPKITVNRYVQTDPLEIEPKQPKLRDTDLSSEQYHQRSGKRMGLINSKKTITRKNSIKIQENANKQQLKTSNFQQKLYKGLQIKKQTQKSQSNISKQKARIFTLNPISPNQRLSSQRNTSKMNLQNISRIGQVKKLQLQEGQVPIEPLTNEIHSPVDRSILKKLEFKLKHGYHNSDQNFEKHALFNNLSSTINKIACKKLKRNESNGCIVNKSIMNSDNQQNQRYNNDEYRVAIHPKKDYRKLTQSRLQSYKEIAQNQHEEEIIKLMKFCVRNYKELSERKIFDVVYSVNPDNLSSEIVSNDAKIERSEGQEMVDIQCNHFGKKTIDIFFSLEEAERHQKKQGLWAKIDSFIMVDNNYNTLSDQVQEYFDKIKEKRPMFYRECILFLRKPYFYCKEIEAKRNKDSPTTVSHALDEFELQKNWVKNIFRTLFRLHKMIHKKCNHVKQFLHLIGCKI